MRKSNLRTSAALQALALLGAGLPAAFIAATPANAQQDYTRGSIQGTVANEAGQPLAGATVTVTSNEQGFVRTTTTAADGSFQFNLLPTGSYTVNIRGAGGELVNDPGVSVVAGKSTNFAYTAVAQATVEGEATPEATAGGGREVVVVGRRVAVNDLGSTTTGLSIDVARIAENIPVPRSQTGLIMLAPGTNQGDQQFLDCGDCVSFGGATIAENAYYVNGLNTTNFRTQVGNSLVPFEFYRTFDVRTGGWTAEFGRALGGVTSAVTKSGSNNFEYGAVITYAPNFLTEDSPNTFNDPESTAFKQLNEDDYRSGINANFYASGALIKDRVFFYGLYSPRYIRQDDTSVIGGFRFRQTTRTPFYGAKVDVIPLDGHRLEGTFWSDEQHTFIDYLPVDENGAINGPSSGTEDSHIGGKNWIVQYTGQFTPWFTLSASHGVNKFARESVGTGDERAIVQSTLTGVTTNVGAPVIIPTLGGDKRTIYRVDADVYANFLGRHHFRFGWDREDLHAEIDNHYPQNRYWLFTPSDIQSYTYINAGGFDSKTWAYYLQDSWDLLNDRLNLQIGIRNDNYQNFDFEGTMFAEMKNQWAPRLGASFDVFGDKRTKLSAFWGRYYLGIATNTNIRQAGTETYYQQSWNYAPGVNPAVFGPTGIPVGQQFDAAGNPIVGGLTGDNDTPCADFGPGAGQLCYAVYADGIPSPAPATFASNLKPMYQDEIIVGATHRMDDWTFGARYITRDLKRTIEDVSIDAGVQAYCEDQGIEGCQYYWYGFHQYVIANPGEDITVQLAGDALCTAGIPVLGIPAQPEACQVVTLTAEQLGFEKPKRKYQAIELLVNKAFNGRYGFDFSYTWQKARGNYEGSVKSTDNQDDAGLTSDFDLPGFTQGAYGILSNEREHTFKFYGSYKPVEWMTVGANIMVQSPRNFSCVGIWPADYAYPDPTNAPALYEDATFWSQNPNCADKAVDTETYIVTDDEGVPTGETIDYYLVPRGTAFKGGWLKNVDLGVQFQLPGALRNSSFRIDVFNIFNWQSKIDFVEFGDNPGRSVREDFGLVTGYQAPRAVRFTWAMRFGGRQ